MSHDTQTFISSNTILHCGVLVLGCLFLFLTTCEKADADLINLESSITGLTLAEWSVAGDVAADSAPFCVASITGDSCSEVSEDYHVRVLNNTPGSSGQFRLLNGANSLPVSLVYTDLITNGQESLIEGNWTSTPKSGPVDECVTQNGQITVTILQAALLAVPAGDYAETMAISFEQADAGSESYADTFVISITVPDLVRISNINDINLGSWGGTGDLLNGDDLCVYRNSGGTYSITFTGDGGSGSGTAFLLTNNSVDLVYNVGYYDGTSNATVSAGVVLTGRSGHHQSSDSCGGGTNATVTVTVLESDMQSVPPATYSGTLTMRVAPE